jgi:hypothetical protein
LETDKVSGEVIVGAARVIFGNCNEICGTSKAVVDVICGFAPFSTSILIVQTLLEKIECVVASMGISSLVILAPILQLRGITAEMDFENCPLIQLFLKCGFQETGGETEVGHLLGNESSQEIVSMILQYKKVFNHSDEFKLIVPSINEDTKNHPEMVNEVLSTEPTMQNLMESLFVCLQKEYGEK